MPRTGVALGLALAFPLMAAAAPASARVHVTVRWPHAVHRSSRQRITGRVTGRVPRGVRVVLQLAVSRRTAAHHAHRRAAAARARRRRARTVFRTLAGSRLGRTGRFSLTYAAPRSGRRQTLRVAVLHGKHVLAASGQHRVTLTAAVSGASTPPASSAPPDASVPAPVGAPAPPPPASSPPATPPSPPTGGGAATAGDAPPFDAAALASSVRNAPTHDQRVSALDALFQAIRMGVRDANLGIVVPGGEQSADDTYLYTAEVELLADQLERGTRVSYDELAHILHGTGISYQDDNCPQCGPDFTLEIPGDAMTGADLENLVMGTVQHADQGTSAADDYGQLIGRLEPDASSDLSRPLPTDAEVIDPLQALLVELMIDASAEQDVVSDRTASPSAQRAARTERAAACSFDRAFQGQGVVQLAKAALSIAGGRVITAALAVPDVVHAAVLGYSVQVTNPGDPPAGAFGIDGPRSAAIMKFKARVEMLDQLPQGAINCGALGGYTFPQKGPVAGIKVDFGVHDLTATGPDITNFGHPVCPSTQQSCYAATTGADGVAELDFQPDFEYLPGRGPTLQAVGAFGADALTLTSTGNNYGSLSEALGMTKIAPESYVITWTQPNGYRIPDQTIKYTEVDDDPASKTTVATTDTFHFEVVCLGSDDRNPLLPDPAEPKQNSADATISEDFGVGIIGNSGFESYTTETQKGEIVSKDDPTDVEPINNTTVRDRIAPIPAQFGIDADGNSFQGAANTLPNVLTKGKVTFAGGTASSALEYDISPQAFDDPNASVDPKTISATAPWSEATECPKPKLPPGVTVVG